MVDFSEMLDKPKIETHITINGEEVDVNSILDSSISLQLYKTIRANSLGFEALIPKLNNETLEYVVEHNLANCSWEPEVTYDYDLKNHLVPELLKRIREQEKVIEEWIRG